MNNEIKAGSKILAEFEGLKHTIDGNYLIIFKDGEWVIPTYHTDYNELMRVAHKFRDLEVEQKESHKYWVHLIYIAVMRHSKEVAFETVVQAVTWYNSLKPKES